VVDIAVTKAGVPDTWLVTRIDSRMESGFPPFELSS
jgi:hypothetical protein